MDYSLGVDTNGNVSVIKDGGDIQVRVIGTEKVSVSKEEAERAQQALDHPDKTVSYDLKKQKLVISAVHRNTKS